MIPPVWISIVVCVAAIFWVLQMARKQNNSIGLPVAYLFTLMTIHLPGALAYFVSDGAAVGVSGLSSGVPAGIWLTAVGAISFCVGVKVATRRGRHSFQPIRSTSFAEVDRRLIVFWACAGFFSVFVLLPFLGSIPSVGAIVRGAGTAWVIGTMIGLYLAYQEKRAAAVLFWICLAFVSPLYDLVIVGFLSYGSTTLIIIFSIFAVKIKDYRKVILGIVFISFLSLNVFANYFEGRTELRSVVWDEGSGFAQKVDAAANTFGSMKSISFEDKSVLSAFSQRLNQNEYVGIAYERLENGRSEFLYGRTFYEAAISVVPRFIWQTKSVFGGSGSLVADLTGLNLSKETSWGVGNVMEFYINFGYSSLILGFVALGFSIGRLDVVGAKHLVGSQPERALLFWLPAIAFIQPNGSLVEIVGGAVSALLAAYILLSFRMLVPRWNRKLHRRRAGRGRDAKPRQSLAIRKSTPER